MDTPLPLPGSSTFHHPKESLRDLDPDATARILSAAGDVTLVLDREGIIRDVAIGSPEIATTPFNEWLNRPWIETVMIDSQPKVREMLAEAAEPGTPRWRQVNHDSAAGQLPLRYMALRAGANGRVIAVGRDMRAAAAMQQRLLQAQQSMERDYIRLRQAESRYRLLFDLSTEAVVVVETATRKITDCNPAAMALAGLGAGVEAGAGGEVIGASLVGSPLVAIMHPDDRDATMTMMGAVSQAVQAAPTPLRMAHAERPCLVSATLFRQDRSAFLLLRLLPVDGLQSAGPADPAIAAQNLLAVVDRMPDAFVLADDQLGILAKNSAFLDLTQHVRHAELRGVPLAGFLGRPGIDFNLLVAQLREHGSVRNFATIIRDRNGNEEDVEVSAVAFADGRDTHFGFSIRAVARRLAAEPASDRDLPRSVEQLTDLVGRVSLKEIVRESTDLIERLCIEAALAFTANNRASAAEILGLSRQSLYSKLHRHGLGNLVADID